MVAIRPGKDLALIANEEVTKAASPNASVQRITNDAQKKPGPGGSRLRNLKNV